MENHCRLLRSHTPRELTPIDSGCRRCRMRQSTRRLRSQVQKSFSTALVDEFEAGGSGGEGGDEVGVELAGRVGGDDSYRLCMR